MSVDNILQGIEKYYSERILTYGPTAKGVDWNSTESQRLSFEQLLKVCDGSKQVSINDYGCGYGALADFMAERGYDIQYRGFDVSSEMITKARELHVAQKTCEFSTRKTSLQVADYTVASGIFNVKLHTNDEEWKEYVLRTVNKIAQLSRKGFAFNLLTKYSDPDHMRKDLYYGIPPSSLTTAKPTSLSWWHCYTTTNCTSSLFTLENRIKDFNFRGY